MPPGTLHFDGQDYADGVASDPIALGWMQGSPPPDDKLIRFEDDDTLSFPKIRWSLSHTRETVPTAAIWRGAGVPRDLGTVDGATQAAIDALEFTDMHGGRRRWADTLADTYTDGIVVLHKGRRVYEQYRGALKPHVPHSCFSVTKSFAGTLCAKLVYEGVLNDRQPIPYYLPEMADTAYADASLREVMDMQVGVVYSEAYSDPLAGIWDFARAGGFRPRRHDHTGPKTLYAYLQTLQKEGAHGEAFAYKTVNTEVMAWVMKRVTGLGLADMVSEQVWQRMGAEEDGYITVDSIGVPFGGGGMSASLRDLARFGELMRCQGAVGGQQVIPEAVVADCQRGADPARFAKAGYHLLPGYSYRNMWWVTHNAHGAFEARGIHGQRLYIAPGADLVVARFASHPIAYSAANDPVTIPGFLALGRLLQG
jgi:CubicO group peptidase (beta-lactamase class C family)